MEGETTSRYTLEGRELVDYLVHRAADDAKAALIERDERRNRRTAFIMSIIALIGVGSLVSALKVFVRGEVDVLQSQFEKQRTEVEKLITAQADSLQTEFKARIEQSVAKAVDAKIGAVVATLSENDQFEQYAELASQLPTRLGRISQHGDKEKYVSAVIREVTDAAAQISSVSRITSRARFITATRQVVDVLTRYNREAEINRLDDILGKSMATDQEMAHTLADHYGQLVVGSPQSIEAMAEDVARLNRYLRASREQNYPEKALIWSVFVEFKRNKFVRNSTVDGLLESSRDLVADDRAEFWYNLYVYTNPLNWMTTPTQQGRELARLMERLQAEYKPEDITGIMERNIANNQSLQQRLAELRAKNPAWQQSIEEQATQQAIAPVAASPAGSSPQQPSTPTETPPQSAEAPTEKDNLLR
jgi:hypothetical protein